MSTRPARFSLALVAAAIAAAPALAHTGMHETSGLAAGLIHPLAGADHLLAMLAVGLWSGFVLPRAFWAGAAAFLVAMAAGAGLGFAGLALPLVEAGILASVVVFGLMTVLASPAQAPAVTTAAMAAIAGFALFHGHAHAAEATGAALPYLAGFLLATAGLHLAGIAVAHAVAGRVLVLRGLGAAIAASGLWLIAG